MSLLKTSGIVIKQVNYGEADRILTILTKDVGKIQVMARGVRKTKSPLLASTQLFCYSNFIFYQGRSFFYINQAELRESFYNIRLDLEKLTIASYILELMNTLAQEHQKEEKFFLLLIHTLKHIAYSDDIKLHLIVLTFQIKLMALAGYAPYLTGCVSCGGAIDQSLKMSGKLGGILCPNCFKQDPYSMGLNQEGKDLLSYILYQPMSSLKDVRISEPLLGQLKKIMSTYITIQLEKSFNTLKFMDIKGI